MISNIALYRRIIDILREIIQNVHDFKKGYVKDWLYKHSFSFSLPFFSSPPQYTHTVEDVIWPRKEPRDYIQ